MAPTLDPAHFKAFLHRWGVPIEEYGIGNAKHVSDLWAEVALGESKLEKEKSPGGQVILVRKVNVAVVELHAFVIDKDMFLILKDMKTQSGSNRRGLNRRITKKMFADEPDDSAVYRCLTQNLGLKEKVCREFELESKQTIEEEKVSDGFPGIRTRYSLVVFRMRIRDSLDADVHKIGLPFGQEFQNTVDGEKGSGSQRRWVWCTTEQFNEWYPQVKTNGLHLRPLPFRPSPSMWMAMPFLLLGMIGPLLWRARGRPWQPFIFQKFTT